jgi:hypothetical protein
MTKDKKHEITSLIHQQQQQQQQPSEFHIVDYDR